MEMRVPISPSSGRYTGESSCKGYYIIVLYLLTFLSIYLRSLLARSVGCIFSFSMLLGVVRIKKISYDLCTMWRSWPTWCLACWRKYWAARSENERDSDPLPLEEFLEVVLMDMEQRRRLIITIDRAGGRSVRLLPPGARALAP